MLYSFLLLVYFLLASPGYLLRIMRGRYRASFRERLGRPVATGGEARWFHAASVGEVEAAGLLVRRVAGRKILSTITETGQAIARKIEGVEALYLPFDFKRCIRRSMDGVEIRIFVILETEIWPNLIDYLASRGVPTVIVNGRISDRAFRRYTLVSSFLAGYTSRIKAVGAQSALDAERFVAIGVPEDAIEVTGNIKWDRTAPPVPAWPLEGPILAAASIHPGEIGPILDAFVEVRKTHPDAGLILAPRHTEKAGTCVEEARKAGLSVGLRSRDEFEADVIVLDTHGELAGALGLAKAAFVGGSLVPFGGHNLLEAAVHSIPVSHGPHMENFREITSRLGAAGATTVTGSRDLSEFFLRSLDDGEWRKETGARLATRVEESRGALERTLELIGRAEG